MKTKDCNCNGITIFVGVEAEPEITTEGTFIKLTQWLECPNFCAMCGVPYVEKAEVTSK